MLHHGTTTLAEAYIDWLDEPDQQAFDAEMAATGLGTLQRDAVLWDMFLDTVKAKEAGAYNLRSIA